MPFNEESFNKYEQDLESANEHYYQNQTESSKEKKKKKMKHKSKQNQKVLQNEQAEPNQFQSSSNLSNAGGVAGGGGGAYAASSTTSSNRELILSRREKQSLSYLILFVSIIFQLGSFVAIVITFIFPFWMVFQIDIPGNFSTLNITNTKNLVFLSLASSSLNTNQIRFSLGIWEVKMNTDKLQLIDLKTGVQTANAQSLLWLNSDSSISFQAFLVNFLSFIEISSANIFTIQILEILHLIFTFLTFCSTSFTLCLCSKNRTNICWYLVCYFLCLVSFLTGLAVIIIVIVWQTSSLPSLIGTQAFLMSKSFDWCFWLAVGINSSLFSASFLIFCYILIGSILTYNRNKRVYEQKTTVSNKHANQTKKAASILKNVNLNTSDLPQNNDYANAKLPRLQTNIVPSSSVFVSNSNPLLASNSTTAFNNLQSLTNNNTSSKDNNPSYTFYTGFGQYHKQNIRLNPIGDDNTLEKSFRVQSQNDHFNNYPMVITSSSNHKANPILSSDHAYSNVFDQMNNHDYRYQSYH